MFCGKPFSVEGNRTRDAGGQGQQFCGPKCVVEWRWENEPESFPQSERKGKMKKCPVCGKQRLILPGDQDVPLRALDESGRRAACP